MIVQAEYFPEIKDIADIFINSDSEEQAEFFNLVSEGFEEFNKKNPNGIKDAQIVSIVNEKSLSKDAKRFIGMLHYLMKP